MIAGEASIKLRRINLILFQYIDVTIMKYRRIGIVFCPPWAKDEAVLMKYRFYQIGGSQ